MVHSIWPKNAKIALIRVALGSLFPEPDSCRTCGFRREFRKGPSFQNIKSLFPKNFYIFYKKLKTAKKYTFSSLLNDPDFFWEIRLVHSCLLITLYHRAKNLRNPKAGSIITFCAPIRTGTYNLVICSTEVENSTLYPG